MQLKNQIASTQIQDDLTTPLNLFQFMHTQLEELDLALEVLAANEPDILDDVVAQYILLLNAHIPSDFSHTVFSNAVLLETEWKHLKEFQDLILPLEKMLISTLKFASPLNLENIDETNAKKYPIAYKPFVRACYYHLYYLFYAVEIAFSREKALDLAKKFGEFVYSRPNPNREKYATLAEFREYIDRVCVKTHNYISGMSENEQYIFKVTRCLYGEALQDVEDPDLMFYLICFGDYFSAHNANDQFVLTRKHTILQGASMCDFCYHDRRTNIEIDHPEESFWLDIS